MSDQQQTMSWVLPGTILLGLISGLSVLSSMTSPIAYVVFNVANVVSIVFINLLKLISLPIIFLAIITTISGLKDFDELKTIGVKVLKYTLLTTIIAASIALLTFLWLDPVASGYYLADQAITHVVGVDQSYLDHLVNVIPSNFVQTFADNNVIGTLIIAAGMGLSILSLPQKKRAILHDFFSSAYAAVFQITLWILKLVPVAIWSFTALFVQDLVQGSLQAGFLSMYLVCVVGANLIQAFIVLPFMLKLKGISPAQTFKKMMPSLQVAFWSKSSSAALPAAISCAIKASIPKRIANISLPLCITINMNACASYILITVLFVSGCEGMVFSVYEMIGWVLVATIAAIGNAGVPMGCFFLSGALLTSMNVPLDIMGYILPFYVLIDMLESAINVWSDACVTFSVAKDLAEEKVENGMPDAETVDMI